LDLFRISILEFLILLSSGYPAKRVSIFGLLNLVHSINIMSRTKQAVQEKSSHWPYLLKNVTLLSIGILSTNHPAIPVRSIALAGKSPLAAM
jgi:hypothetical protein